MVLFRCLAGVFSGTVVTVQAMVKEHSTSKTQAYAFSYFAFAGNIGIFFGPMFGGALADPAGQYGGPLKKIQFFHDYPYALPSLAVGVVGLSAAVISAFFVEETLQSKKSANVVTSEPPMSTWELIKSPGVANVLSLYNVIRMLGMAYTAVVPVFWFTSVSKGGVGFTPLLISIFLGAAGLSQSLWTLFVFPRAHDRWGTGGVLRFCGIVWPAMSLINPVCNAFLRQGWEAAFWTVMPLGPLIGSSCIMSLTSVQLALNDISPSPAVFGTLNAVALAVSSGVRAFTPALFASLFAAGVRGQILGGYLAWVVLVILALGVAVTIRFLPAKAQGLPQKVADGENDQE
ncbi:hypothetical protein AAFC00_002630 [Neodothiora populina]|uniref:Major facilitator superfamily transporter n=1 Tax=Neodothiora populina TaxID=2781224 RepID=A0ABR3P7R8_9PEZI